jgi:hypothetical protein
MSVGGDCVSLLALSRLRDGDVCGFRTARTNTPICQYTINGIGCPQAGLSPQQVDIRKKFGIDDWCHWTYWSLATRIATSSTQKEWDNRFAKNGVVA